MSHFSTIQVQIKNGEVLEETLQELGYSVERNTTVRGYEGNTTQADYVIRQANQYDVGFRLEGETYQLITDLWGANLEQSQFINTLQQKYAHKMLMKTVKNQGFNIETEETLTDGSVRVVVGRWV